VERFGSSAARGCSLGSRKAKHGSEGRKSDVREWRDHLGAHDNKSVTETGKRHLFFVKPMVGADSKRCWTRLKAGLPVDGRESGDSAVTTVWSGEEWCFRETHQPVTWRGAREHERVSRVVEGLDTKFFFSMVTFGQQLKFESVEGVLGGSERGP
jgi:hypothetical protein